MFKVTPLLGRHRIHMKNQALFSSKDKSKKLKCHTGLHLVLYLLKALAVVCFVVVVALLFYVHGKHLRSCRDG